MKTNFVKAGIKKLEHFCDGCTVKEGMYGCLGNCRGFNQVLFSVNEETKASHPSKFTANINGRTIMFPIWEIN